MSLLLRGLPRVVPGGGGKSEALFLTANTLTVYCLTYSQFTDAARTRAVIRIHGGAPILPKVAVRPHTA